MAMRILVIVLVSLRLHRMVVATVTCGEAKAAYKEAKCCGQGTKPFIEHATAHVSDVEKCMEILSDAREAHATNSSSFADFVKATYTFDSDGGVIQPYVFALKLAQGDLSAMTVDAFTTAREVLVHPFFPAGPAGKKTFEKDSASYRGYEKMLKASDKRDGFLFSWDTDFQTAPSHKNNDWVLTTETTKAYLGMMIQPERMALSCAYREYGALGPLAEHQKSGR